MSYGRRIAKSNFFIKLKSWEYWPFGIIQAPLFIYWLWLSIKARSLLYFTASNPGILTGGMFGESKFEILEKIPPSHKPNTLLIQYPASVERVIQLLSENGFSFPLIFKPDIGERGWMVKKISTTSDVIAYLHQIKTDFIIQEYVDLPLEFSVYYARHPDEQAGKVTSVTMKEMLKVRGDGQHTLQELILAKDRAKLQWENLKITHAARLTEKLKEGEEIELVPIGNHCLGTTFLNRNNLITPKLSESFDRLSKHIDGFYFGRYDLRAASFEDLENGKVKIVELNGCGAEPSHIYHPGASIVQAVKDLFIHWRTIFVISMANHKKGTPFLSLREGIAIYKKFKAITTAS